MSTEHLLNWLDKRVNEGLGTIELSLNEEGGIGLFRNDNELAWGTGLTVEEAIREAFHKYPNGKPLS